MKKTLTTLLCAAPILMFAQPELDNWQATTGVGTYDYYPGAPPTTSSVTMTEANGITQVCYDVDHVYVEGEGLAISNMGPWAMNPNVPSGQGYNFKIPRNPVEETGTKQGVPQVGAVGAAIDGVVFYGWSDAR